MILIINISILPRNTGSTHHTEAMKIFITFLINFQTYDWDNKSLVLSSFYMGYICLQVLAGELGKKYGPKWFLVGAMVVNSGE